MIVDRRSFTNHVSFGKDRGEVLKHNIQVHLHEKLLTESNFGGFDKKKIKRPKDYYITNPIQGTRSVVKRKHD